MRFSQLLIPTLRDAPRDADTVSAKLMIRAGMVRKIASGLYDWLPLGLRSLKKCEQIVREEMNAAFAQEVWLPTVQPRELWEETGRWQVYGKELLRFKDRKGSEFCYAPTAEEVITDLVRKDVSSYRQLPVCLYQFGSKFRDEIRPRFGVMRAREFYMKDAYSFHASESDAEAYYGRMLEAYKRIFERCGLNFRPVEADTGAIGGSFSHEFMVLADTGEEEIASCPVCGYAANVERAEGVDAAPAPEKNGLKSLEEVSTPNAYTVEDVARLMKEPKEKFIKTLFYLADGAPVVALIRGDSELNEPKLARALGAKIVEKMPEEQYASLADCQVGYAGPVGLKERCLKRDPRFKLFADTLVRSVVNGVSGANKKDAHVKNINLGRDYEVDQFFDLRKVKAGDLCPRCHKEGRKNPLAFSRGIEVGHAFNLGTKYSSAMKATFLDEKGQPHPFIMGCYGIGVSRVLAAAIEQNNDANGIIWTKALAPYQVAVIATNYGDAKIKERSDRLYKEISELGLDVLLDDRDERAGVKFKDADLIGFPLRVTLGEKGVAKGIAEVKPRSAPQFQEVPLEKVISEVKKFFET